MKILPYIFIVAGLLVLGGIYIDQTSPKKEVMTNALSMTNSGNVALKNFGQAPEFAGINNWLNSEPLTMQQLRGKVVLVDFWTYSCINCIRTLPFVTKWHEDYKDKGLVIVGVHTPEFEFEKIKENVQIAIKRFNISYPVAQDNSFATWVAYKNRYWPAKYLVDKDGKIVYTHFGEGDYEQTENAIRQLLGLEGKTAEIPSNGRGDVRSPEMYFGTERIANLSPAQSPSSQAKNYSLPSEVKLNNFALEGIWKFDAEKIILTEKTGKIVLKFFSGKVFMVAEAGNSITLKITVDGKPQPEVIVNMSQLYTLFDSSDYGQHTMEIEILDSGFQAFTFTFG